MGDDFSLNFKQFFHWPFINAKQSMFTFASLVFLQAIDIFLLIFNLFPLFAERGRRNLEEIIHNENQLLHKSGVECQIDSFACFAAYSLFIFSERKCISRSWRKLMNYKPEKRIPWLFTDFDNIKDFPWLCKKFPDFSLTLEKFSFFPDFSLTVVTLS